MPIQDVRVPDPQDEDDLPPIAVPATAAAGVFQLPDLRLNAPGVKYVSCLVVNASATTVTLKDAIGRLFVIQSGQPGDCDFYPGVTWLGLVPTAAINAGEVQLIPTVKRPRYA